MNYEAYRAAIVIRNARIAALRARSMERSDRPNYWDCLDALDATGLLELHHTGDVHFAGHNPKPVWPDEPQPRDGYRGHTEGWGPSWAILVNRLLRNACGDSFGGLWKGRQWTYSHAMVNVFSLLKARPDLTTELLACWGCAVDVHPFPESTEATLRLLIRQTSIGRSGSAY